ARPRRSPRTPWCTATRRTGRRGGGRPRARRPSRGAVGRTGGSRGPPSLRRVDAGRVVVQELASLLVGQEIGGRPGHRGLLGVVPERSEERRVGKEDRRA